MEGLSQVRAGREQSVTSRPRGRPSLVAPFTPQITQWLRENPHLSSVEILRRVQLAGYRGRKSALYEFVKRLRTCPAAASSAESQSGAGRTKD